MRKRRWLELVKDFDCEILYHPGKANRVADALSRESAIAVMSLKPLSVPLQQEISMFEIELISGELSTLSLESTLQEEIKKSQDLDPLLKKIKTDVRNGIKSHFVMADDGIVHFGNRVCVPNTNKLWKQIIRETHETWYSVHPWSTKMYKDLKKSFWWPSMKNDVATFVSKCLTCQKVKVERQFPVGELQRIDIPEWR